MTLEKCCRWNAGVEEGERAFEGSGVVAFYAQSAHGSGHRSLPIVNMSSMRPSVVFAEASARFGPAALARFPSGDSLQHRLLTLSPMCTKLPSAKVHSTRKASKNLRWQDDEAAADGLCSAVPVPYYRRARVLRQVYGCR